MSANAQTRTVKTIDILDSLTILHSRTSAVLAALSMAFDSEYDQLQKSTIQEVLETAQSLLKKAQEEVLALNGSVA
ncbi:hypothetical protein QN379_17535 [Glaciimonas sp. Gout2]|uniref:hypothetical protein n=1 Tax=unclassified Glaciimonas TaxID=2644401 RepID=UPI002AB37142|nr:MULTISPECIES: hypothetical protein [unclassified Glaciimonas]MDY7548718.1 hypothetical protein [Glaciimonas sp. CA11.2]MEB0013879.1 hypothetical protein [Glaciimonas sp. Cout2]MEB0083813.1 hypothetical protein [Glaciimonas sp. Gout2]